MHALVIFEGCASLKHYKRDLVKTCENTKRSSAVFRKKCIDI